MASAAAQRIRGGAPLPLTKSKTTLPSDIGGDRLSPPSFQETRSSKHKSRNPYHDRMPLIPEDGQFDDWMRDTPDQAAELMERVGLL